MTRPRHSLAALAVSALLLSAAGPGQTSEKESDPWNRLAELRASWVNSGPLEVPFVQTFVPAGFDEGDSESGRMTLGLPRCVRWDYSEPYPKSYLLCGTDLHAWNPGETVGHLYALDETRPGLDLLLLDREDLEDTYRARGRQSPEGITVHLQPRDPSSRALAEVRIRMTAEADRILELSYRDGERNRTVFDFGRPVSVDEPDRFVPPGDLEWVRETS